MYNSNLSTPSYSRMAKISEKLSGMNMKFDQERILRLDQVEQRARNVDDRFVEFNQTVQNRNTQLREQLLKLQRVIEEERQIRDTQMDSKLKEMMQIEQKYSYLIENEIKARKESEFEIGKYVDDRWNALKMELLKVSKIRADETEQ